MNLLKPTTPTSFSLEIKSFINKFIPGKPEWSFLPFTEISVFPTLPQQCHINTNRYCQTYNVDVAFGWIIWTIQEINFYEAMFHSVVVENNQLKDITPRQDNEDMVLFVHDNIRRANILQNNNELYIETYSNFKQGNGILTEGTYYRSKFGFIR